MKQELNLIDYWHIAWKYKYLISGIFIVAVTVSMLRSLSIPKTYKAAATILPPMDTPASSNVDILRNAGIRLTTKATPTDIFVGILKSRQMQDDIIDRFNLMEVYKTDIRQSARQSVASRTDISISREQMISVSFIDTVPERSAEIANFYVKNLDTLNRNLNITTAGQLRRFVEQRLEETKQSLREAEEKLEVYRIKNKTAGGIHSASVSAGGLEGRLIAKKIELEAKKKYTTENNPETIKLKNEITEMEKALAQMPPVENELARLIRELSTQENVYRLLVNQYEQAKIEEARDTPTVQVLDYAVIPERKHGPAIKKNMMVSGLAALFIGFFLASFFDYINHNKQSANRPVN
jgi:uncharacterized protein involved in exopolysaccharide biosynthesis